MPIVTVKMLEGRTEEQKRQLARELTEVVARVAVAKESDMHVIIEEYTRTNWAKGGKLFSDC